MKELILRRVHAAGKHGSITLSTVPVKRWKYINVSNTQQCIRCRSTQSAQARAGQAGVSRSPSRKSKPPSTTRVSPDIAQQSQSRLATSDAVAPPVPANLVEQGSEPTVSGDRLYAVDGIVKSIVSTRPPPLNLPKAPHPHAWPYKGNWKPGRWDFKYIFSLGKTYAAFYWAGVKQFYGNFKMMYRINNRLSGTSPNAAARYVTVAKRISYDDYEMITRTRHDMWKCIPFLLVLAVCGEFTPLVIVALGPSVVPGPCVIPKQVVGHRKKMLERDHIYMQEVSRLLRACDGDFGKIAKDRRKIREMHNLIAYRAGLTPFKKLAPVLGGLYWRFRTQKKLAQHCDEILSVAVLVEREGGWAKKSPQDMWEWADKYGLYRLREFTAGAVARGEDPVSEEMKTSMLPHVEAEVRSMLEEDFTRIPRRSHCTIALNSPLYHRPDIDFRNESIEQMAGMSATAGKSP